MLKRSGAFLLVQIPMLNQTNFAPSDKCDANEDSKAYLVPLGTCYNPGERFQNDQQWGESDVLDMVEDGILNRSFFLSANGSCAGFTSGFQLPLGECLGPFGKPRPWGRFEVA